MESFCFFLLIRFAEKISNKGFTKIFETHLNAPVTLQPLQPQKQWEWKTTRQKQIMLKSYLTLTKKCKCTSWLSLKKKRVLPSHRTKNDFFGKNFIFKFLGPKGTQNGPKMRFFNFPEKSMHWTFLIFALQQHIGMKLIKRISQRKSCTWVFGQKGAQNEFFEFHNKSMYWIFLVFAGSYKSIRLES